ncbi:MAG TPA: hypothetical protein VK815_10910 [Candidatus Acidoferrales bacterium]|nr:hypothetical protein [Candidatus Acidoferrales bacterium]
MLKWFTIQNQERQHMKNRFNLFQRSGVFYCEDTTTGKQTSLRTRDRADAVRLLHVKNEAMHQPAMNLQIPLTKPVSWLPDKIIFNLAWQHQEFLKEVSELEEKDLSDAQKSKLEEIEKQADREMDSFIPR